MHTKLALVRQNNALDFAQFSLLKTIDLADRQNEIVQAAKDLKNSGVLPKDEPAIRNFLDKVENWFEFAQEDESVLERLAKASTTLSEKRPLKIEVEGELSNINDSDAAMAELMQRVDLYSYNYDTKLAQKAAADMQD